MKSLMKEKEMHLRQRSCNTLPVRCCATSDNNINKFDITKQPFAPMIPKVNKKCLETYRVDKAIEAK